jgi:type VI secretion system protein ImpC
MRRFRILVAGDFSGRAPERAGRRSLAPQLVDRDNFDEVLSGMHLSVEAGDVSLSLHTLEDFHPDHIYQALPPTRPSRPATLSRTPSGAPVRKPAEGAGFLDQILDAHAEAEPQAVSAEDANDLSAFIRRASAGSFAPREDPDLQDRHAAAGQLRAILRDPRFQAIEAAWRALDMLVRGWDEDALLEVYILDATLPELVEGMAEIAANLEKKGSWGLLAANYVFGQSELDARVLDRLAKLAKRLGAPLIAGALPPGEAVSEAWEELRKSPDARWIGLALPRFLLRLPYGKDTSPIEAFPFEEMPESEHSAYLWGNPAFLCAYLIGQSFVANGWELGGRLQRRVDGLPMHVYREDGEPVAKPCAEILMTERDAENLLEAGFMPVASLKEQDAALVVRFQSIADPATTLAGLTGRESLTG